MKPDFQQAYDLYRNLVWALIARMEIRGTDAEDLSAEIWEAVSARWEGYEGRASLKNWIAAIARYRCISHRRRRRELLLEDLGLTESARAGSTREVPATVRADARRILSRALDRLPAGDRFLLELAGRGFRYREIAASYRERWPGKAVDEHWVARRLYGCREKLRQILAGWGIVSLEDIWE